MPKRYPLLAWSAAGLLLLALASGVATPRTVSLAAPAETATPRAPSAAPPGEIGVAPPAGSAHAAGTTTRRVLVKYRESAAAGANVALGGAGLLNVRSLDTAGWR